jgi:RNA-binding protein YhbY
MIKFKKNTTLQVIVGYDEATDNITEEIEEHFKANELVDAEIYDEDGKYCDLQYGDGSISTGVLRSCFVIVKGK